ncbi:MAG: antitoxin Xre-like helix-turn-helix domain-containing protein [Candidatus Velthaea sp.]
MAIKAFFKIAERWKLGRPECARLLAASQRSIDRWKAGTVPDLNRDQVERISYVLAIYGGLHAIFGESPIADTWVRDANADFGGREPVGRMLDGNVGDLAEVSTYIARWKAGW